MKRLIGLSLCAIVACTVESGGEQSPIFEGSGVSIAEDGSGRTVSVNEAEVPRVMNCNPSDVIRKTAMGWECVATAETDPSVNALGKATLACGADQIPRFVMGSWTCSTDGDTQLTETQVDMFADNNGYALDTDLGATALDLLSLRTEVEAARGLDPDLDTRLSAIEANIATILLRLDEVEAPPVLVDGFERAGPSIGGPEWPIAAIWTNDGVGGDIAELVMGGLQREQGGGTYYEVTGQHGSPQGNYGSRLRFAFTPDIPPAGPAAWNIQVRFYEMAVSSGTGIIVSGDGTGGSDNIGFLDSGSTENAILTPPLITGTTYYVEAFFAGDGSAIVELRDGSYTGMLLVTSSTTTLGTGFTGNNFRMRINDSSTNERGRIEEVSLSRMQVRP